MQPIQIVKDYDCDAMILCNNILQSFKLKTLQRDPFAKFDMQEFVDLISKLKKNTVFFCFS